MMENSITILALGNLFLPLLSFAVLIFFGKRLGEKSHWVALALVGGMLGIAISFFANVFINTGSPILESSVSWFTTGHFSVDLGFLIDNVAAIMMLVVAIISFLVHFYSVGYMKGDPRYSRYFAYLGLFTFSMNGIVLADNLVMMYIFWELVGLSSYLLIGFWFEKHSAADACKKAFLTNRVGDIGMFIGIMILFFTIGTFQHVLEGYKVADAIAKHGAGASTFTDWWGYKMEAYDAIPYNGALMYNAGVLVTFNSDSGELARRLNTEAAKAVKYGGVDQVEALKFVTLNAAKQLRVDDQVGSLEPGKDADFVIWNGHPLSTYTLCEQTWIEGRKYFDIDEDQKMRQQVKRERTLLIQKLLKPKDKAPKGPEAS